MKSLVLEQDQIFKYIINEWIQNFKEHAKSIVNLRFTTFQAIAFSALRSITKYNSLYKRDASIISCLENNGETCINQGEISKILIEHLKNIDGQAPNDSTPTVKPLPKLGSIKNDEMHKILSRLSTGKALTRFPIPDQFMKLFINNEQTTALQELWEPSLLEKYPEIFHCKLIPLNKVSPHVPKSKDMRPIVATNPIFKILELRFTEELQEKFWTLDGFATSQFGFLKGMSTQSQIYNILEQTTQGWARTPDSKHFKFQSALHPQLPRYNPKHNYLIFIDFRQAYNSVNLELLHKRMNDDKIMDEKKLTYLFSLYSRLKIFLHEHSYQPKKGVPQGGINSPILFNYAMFYFFRDAAERINLQIKLKDGLFFSPNLVTPRKTFLWADDLANLIIAHPNKAKTYIKIFFTILIEEGEKWGLFINFDKCGIMEMFTSRRNYNYLSDSETQWKKNEGCNIKLVLYPNSRKREIAIPITTKYKYLGVIISRNLDAKPHLKYLKQKTNFITNAFTSVRIASNNIKFCFNTWEIFVRPLLDYSQTLANYFSPNDKTKFDTLYRQSLRKMLFLNSSTPVELIDQLIQYKYKSLCKSYFKNAKDRAEARMEKLYKDPRLSKKVDFGYTKLDLNNIPQTWIKIWNLISTKSLKCFVKSHQHPENFKNSKKHLLETLAEHKNYDLIYKLNNCLYTNSFRKDLHKEFFEIYNLLLSFIRENSLN